MNPIGDRCQRWTLSIIARGTERGSATVFVVGFAMVLFACAGLAIDGGRAINERDRATDVAEQAARVGADQLDKVAMRGGTMVLDQDSARARAESFVVAAGYPPPTVSINTSPGTANLVTVRVSATCPTALLGIVGINSIDVSGVATADPATGTDGATP